MGRPAVWYGPYVAYRGAHGAFASWDERLAEHEQLAAEVERLTAALEDANASKAMLGHLATAERQDVDDLSTPSFSRLMLRLTGRFEETLGNEIIEAEEARGAHARQVRKTSALERDLSKARKRLEALGDVRGNYVKALQARASEVAASDPGFARQVQVLEETVASARARRDGLAELLELGDAALRDFDDALRTMNELERWGTWETRDFRSSVGKAKRARLRDANRLVRRACASLETLETRIKTNVGDIRLPVAEVGPLSWSDVTNNAIAPLIGEHDVERAVYEVSNARVALAKALELPRAEHDEASRCGDEAWAAYVSLVRGA